MRVELTKNDEGAFVLKVNGYGVVLVIPFTKEVFFSSEWSSTAGVDLLVKHDFCDNTPLKSFKKEK